MDTPKYKKIMSLKVCRRLLPFSNAIKYAAFLAAIFFHRDDTQVAFIICVSLVFLTLSLDTFLRVCVWKCPHCCKSLPSDFYSRKTITICPACKENLGFSETNNCDNGNMNK